MSETTWGTLRDVLVAKYDSFRSRLARRVGSDDLARELLHETYVRLSRSEHSAAVRNPEPYLYRTALNIAADWRRAEGRKATDKEIEAAIDLVDETARTEDTVASRLDISVLEDALQTLPDRRRRIFLAARVHETPIGEIAQSLGISKRLVELELKRALVHCAGRLDRPVIRRFGPKAPESSYTMKGERSVGEETS